MYVIDCMLHDVQLGCDVYLCMSACGPAVVIAVVFSVS